MKFMGYSIKFDEFNSDFPVLVDTPESRKPRIFLP